MSVASLRFFRGLFATLSLWILVPLASPILIQMIPLPATDTPNPVIIRGRCWLLRALECSVVAKFKETLQLLGWARRLLPMGVLWDRLIPFPIRLICLPALPLHAVGTAAVPARR